MSWEVPIMRSKTSFFNGTIFRKCLTRYWPLWLLYATVLTFAVPVRLSSNLRWIEAPGRVLRAGTILYESAEVLPVLTVIFGVVIAAAMFDFLFSTRGTGLMASLPVRRENVFFSCFGAGAAILLSSDLLIGLFTLLVEATSGAVHLASLLTWMGALAMESLTFYSIAVFCAVLTGHVLILPCLYVLLNFGAPILQMLLQTLVQMFVYGVNGSVPGIAWLSRLSPCVTLVARTGATYPVDDYAARYDCGFHAAIGFSGWGVIAVYFAVGLALAVCALLVFRRRRMETAQDTCSIPWLRPVLKYIVTFYCALGFPLFIRLFFGYNNVASLPLFLVLVVLGTAIGYFVSEMIIHKSLRVFRGRWKGLLVAAAACCLFVCALNFDVFGYAGQVPETATIERVTVGVYGDHYTITDDAPEAIETMRELHKSLFSHRTLHVNSTEKTWVSLNYVLKDGSTVSRRYYVSVEEAQKAPDSDARRLEALLNSPDVRNDGHVAEIDVTPESIDYAHVSYTDRETDEYQEQPLTAGEAYALYRDGILPDLEAGAFGGAHLFTDEAYEDGAYGADVEIWLYWTDADGAEKGQALDFFLTPASKNTIAWLEAHEIHVAP